MIFTKYKLTMRKLTRTCCAFGHIGIIITITVEIEYLLSITVTNCSSEKYCFSGWNVEIPVGALALLLPPGSLHCSDGCIRWFDWLSAWFWSRRRT